MVTPERGDGLELRVELDATFTVKVQVTQDGTLVAGKREHRGRYRDWYVDPDLSCFHFERELTRGRTRVGEKGGAVTVPVGVDGGDGVVKRVDVLALE